MIKKIYKKYEIIFNVIFFSIFPITAFYLMEFYEHNPFEEVRFMAGFFNIILFELIAWILYFVAGFFLLTIFQKIKEIRGLLRKICPKIVPKKVPKNLPYRL